MTESTLLTYTRPNIESLHTLTGVSLESFCIMHKIAALIRRRRSRPTTAWDDDYLTGLSASAAGLEDELEKEKQRLDLSVTGELHSQPPRISRSWSAVVAKPHFHSHRYFHEAVRIACLLQLRCFVLGNHPASFNVRLLVRKSLSLLEVMAEHGLPGFCSAHWVIFTTAICAASGGQRTGELDDRERIGKLYDVTM